MNVEHEKKPDDAVAAVPEVSIIIVSYNTRDLTIACIGSVLAETKIPYEVVVVDNASSDGSAKAIAETFPDVTLLAEDTNHGFAAAHAVAVPHCRAPLLLLLNPDTLVLDQAIDRLVAFSRARPEARIWGGRTVFADRSLNPYSCWRRMSLWTVFCRTAGLTGLFPNSALFNAEEYGGWARDTEREVDIVTGCLLLISREFWDELGGFAPEYTMYGEDADLCLRARARGARPAISPEATIVHYGAASEPVASDRIVRVLRAKAELIKSHFGPVTRPLSLALLKAFPASRAIATGVLHRLSANPSHETANRVWKDVWRRRGEWVGGFT